MTTASMIEVLKAHLAKEGLVLCKANDTQFPLDGFKENTALNEIIELVSDSKAADWDMDTTPIPADVLAELRATS